MLDRAFQKHGDFSGLVFHCDQGNVLWTWIWVSNIRWMKGSDGTYIEYYNEQRITVKLKGLTPVQDRNQSLLTA